MNSPLLGWSKASQAEHPRSPWGPRCWAPSCLWLQASSGLCALPPALVSVCCRGSGHIPLAQGLSSRWDGGRGRQDHGGLSVVAHSSGVEFPGHVTRSGPTRWWGWSHLPYESTEALSDAPSPLSSTSSRGETNRWPLLSTEQPQGHLRPVT